MTETKEIKINMQPSHVKVYRFVENFIDKNIFSPDVPEIAEKTGLSSRQVHRLVEDLVLLGYMTKEWRQKRSLKILKTLG